MSVAFNLLGRSNGVPPMNAIIKKYSMMQLRGQPTRVRHYLGQHIQTAAYDSKEKSACSVSKETAIPGIIDEAQQDKGKIPLRVSSGGSSIKAYWDLAKAKLSALVATTTAAGFVAAGEPIYAQGDVLLAVLVGTYLCSASAAAWNQILEVSRDKRMKRTQLRPLVTGDLKSGQAVVAASLWGLAGTGVLAVGTDPITTLLGTGNMLLYAGLYTYMKPVSVYNTWVGAVVGAIPPIMGWTAATGGSLLHIEPALLGATLYLWQMPHFFALSYMHRVDYRRGGFQMIPVQDNDGVQTASIIVRYAWYLSTIPFVATATSITSSMFALEGIVLNAYALKAAYQFQHDRTNANARHIFLTSLWYLPCLLMLFLLHSKVWDEEKEDVVARLISQQIHWIRNFGRDWCLHEAAVASVAAGPAVCPVSVGASKTKEASLVVAAACDDVSESVRQTSK